MTLGVLRERRTSVQTKTAKRNPSTAVGKEKQTNKTTPNVFVDSERRLFSFSVVLDSSLLFYSTIPGDATFFFRWEFVPLMTRGTARSLQRMSRVLWPTTAVFVLFVLRLFSYSFNFGPVFHAAVFPF
ncbi:hypothetical protein ABB37_06081 [Leptomonas pyrrhocoris]|uniref:Transmembrane protein n=1 Tax=Leptomonas pyrrhocoris TaxID=157538 RepID=A0A0N0DUE7_LEPPY|nr:hypothetical protein ABB37_06081 [Leptomonas pyrrhocoris]KPA78454.1 hypothetical protein ABB37_06081 [Leptomonas pyrrhocoris]|eukprot:XP_015656893.1 hypothetical protein ABB37_06081 [Leptomonas pyrrhocoris]